MIRITLKQLQEMDACEDGITWFKGQSARGLRRIISALLKSNHADYAFWLLPRLMTQPQKVNFAIYAAEQVLEIFEGTRLGDDRPRKAIQAAKDFLAGKVDAYAASAAADAAYAAAAATYAAKDADYAAYAANAAAYAANAAAYAAYAAKDAAYAAAAANAAYVAYAAKGEARTIIQKRLADHALELLGETKVPNIKVRK